MTTSYKGYEIEQYTKEITGQKQDMFLIRLNGEHKATLNGDIESVRKCIDNLFEDLTPQPVDPYEGLELSEDVPTSEEINAALGVKNPCSFMQAVEANTAENASCLPVKERQFTEEQKHFYWGAYHEGYKQAQAELNDIINP